ncbi:MAG: MFS transporter [Desulfobacterales bacterium]
MSHFNMLVFPALVLPLMARLEMPMAQVLSLSFWMYLLFGVTALFWGLLADHFGARPLLFIYFLGSSLASGAAALWLDTPLILSVALAALGFFSGIYHPAGLGMISKEMSRVSIGMGYNGMFGNLGLAMAPLLTGVMNWLWGPQAAYVCLGGLNLGGAVLMMAYPMEVSDAAAVKEKSEGNGILRAFLILLAAMMLGGIVYRGATVILPAYFELKTPMLYQWLTGFTQGTLSHNLVATAITSVIFLIGVGGQFSGGQFADRYDPSILYLIFFGIAGLAAFWLALARDLLLVGLAVFFFFFLLGMQPIENTLVARFAPKRFHHSAFGAKFVLTFGVGALAVKGVAAIETNYDIETVFICLAGAAAIALGFIGWLIVACSRRNAAEGRVAAETRLPSTEAKMGSFEVK